MKLYVWQQEENKEGGLIMFRCSLENEGRILTSIESKHFQTWELSAESVKGTTQKKMFRKMTTHEQVKKWAKTLPFPAFYVDRKNNEKLLNTTAKRGRPPSKGV
jgi:hypothetical protein